MRKFVQLSCFVLLLFANVAFAAVGTDSGENLPPVILSGLDAYKTRGADEAVRAWIKASPIDGSKVALAQSDNLHQIENVYGAYRGFEIVGERTLSPTTRVLYLILDYEKGPLFGRFVVYKSSQGWILTSFNFNTETDKVFADMR